MYDFSDLLVQSSWAVPSYPCICYHDLGTSLLVIDALAFCTFLLSGKVYNITPYADFHPGGIPELMRGAGKDGTTLFDEVSLYQQLTLNSK